jgi:putative transposase
LPIRGLPVDNPNPTHQSPVDDDHFVTAVRYVALNPVRARLVTLAADWRGSSVHAHLSGVDDGLVTVRPVLQVIA